MKKVTLGGDRLGAGNKMKVELHGYERSTHDMGYVWRSSMSAGTLVPFICQVGLPGDTWDITINADIKTHPTIGPLFGSYKAQYDVFMIPIRLYNGFMHNNTLNLGRNISQVKLPLIEMTATDTLSPGQTPTDRDNSQINPSSLLKYLGISGIGTTDEEHTRQFNATAILAYWEIFKNYYSNKQEEIGVVIHTPAEALIETIDVLEFGGDAIPFAPTELVFDMAPGMTVEIQFTGTQPKPEQVLIKLTNGTLVSLAGLTGPWTLVSPGVLQAVYIRGFNSGLSYQYISPTQLGVGKPSLKTFPLTEIDHMRNLLMINISTSPYIINTANIEPYKYLYEQPNGFPNILSSQEGLAVKTYQSDLFNNWLNTDWIDGTGGITEVTAIDTSGGSFTIDTLNLSKKVYQMLNRIAVSDGSLDSWQEATYDHKPFSKAETPMYMGGLIKELIFQEVVSNSETDGQPLGTLAGKGVLAKKHKGGRITCKVDEPCYIMGIHSLTPRIDYSQGNAWDIHLKTLDDLHKPALDEIGFQELITEQFAWWDTDWNGTTWVQRSAGKQPSWMNYRTNVNKCYGNFAIANNEMFMTLNRRYESFVGGDPATIDIKDLTTYIDPSKFNNIFAETALDAQNFWSQIAVDMIVRRKMSARLMPNL